MVTIFCSFSNQDTASLSPPLESGFGHVTSLYNGTEGNTTPSEAQKVAAG